MFKKLPICIVTALALSACVSNAVDSNGQVKGEPKFESIQKDTFTKSSTSQQRGIILSGKNDPRLGLAKIGVSKQAIMSESGWGRPHYHEGFGSKLLTYNFSWATPNGFEHCQVKLGINSKNVIGSVVDNPRGCSIQTVTEVPQEVKQPAPTIRKVELQADALFAFDKSELRQQYHKDLSDIADLLGKMDSINQIVIAGHTDPFGSDEYNQRLSEARAHAVANYLVAHGAPANLIKVVGVGESEQVKDCGFSKPTAEAKACNEVNRRVVIYIDGAVQGQ